jgi:hypothetical protein
MVRNRAGIEVRFGTGSGSQNYYCGRELIPGSDAGMWLVVRTIVLDKAILTGHVAVSQGGVGRTMVRNTIMSLQALTFAHYWSLCCVSKGLQCPDCQG